jgi:predicted secreted protein
MKKSSLPIFLVILFSLNCFAQGLVDSGYDLNFVGFSNDGKYLAFEEYGGQDPSDSLLSNLYFIDVSLNKYARKPSFLEETDYENVTLESVRQRARKNNETTLNQLKIVDGNKGEKIFFSSVADSVDKVEFTRKSVKYKLEVNSIPFKYRPHPTEDLLDSFRLELSLKNQKTKAIQILQKDGAKVNRGSTGYTIKEVYLYKDMIAVFLVYSTWGHYGQIKYLVVTGKIK